VFLRVFHPDTSENVASPNSDLSIVVDHLVVVSIREILKIIELIKLNMAPKADLMLSSVSLSLSLSLYRRVWVSNPH